MELPDSVKVITKNADNLLNGKKLADYRSEREDCLSWLLTFGKDPKRAEGYAEKTVSNRAYRMDRFYRWVWEEYGGYTTDVTHDHADAWMDELARMDKSNAHKENSQKAVKMLFKWRHHQHGLDEWEPEIQFSATYSATTPRDFLTLDERRMIREAALEYGSIPSRKNLSSEEREGWEKYLAQRFEKPTHQVDKDDWDRANNWKIPSLVWVSLDTGLRPVEVERAVVDWVDAENCVLRIPKEDSSKNTENWRVSIRQKTADALVRWIEQRRNYDLYDGTDKLWLTKHGNPYSSQSLTDIIDDLCEIAGISTDNRKMSWYSIRHSVGTYMTREEGLAAAQAQLRHKSRKTTMKYDQAPTEDRRDALDRMG